MTVLLLKYIKLIIFFSLLVSCSTISSKDEKVIIGETSWENWKAESGWNLIDYYSYQPDTALLTKLANVVEKHNLTFLVFASSICEDCKEEVPKIFKLFDNANIPLEKIRLIGLDRDVKEPSGEYEHYNLKKLPLLIIFSNDNKFAEISSNGKDWLKSILTYFNN